MADKSLDPEELKPEPKQRQAKPDRPPARQPQRMSTRRLEQEVGGLLVTVNVIIAFTPAAEDALTEEEIAVLSKALIAQAESSERFRGWLEAAVRSQGGTMQLAVVVLMIAGRRVIRHRLPAEQAAAYEARLDFMLSMMAGLKPKPSTSSRTREEPVEPEPAEPAPAAGPHLVPNLAPV